MLLFLGAGASNPFGVPTTKEFIRFFEKEVGNQPLYEGIKQALGEENLDLESLMTVLSDLSKSRKELHNSIAPHTFRFLDTYPGTIDPPVGSGEMKKEAETLLDTLRKIVWRKCLAPIHDGKCQEKIVQVYSKLLDVRAIPFRHSSGAVQSGDRDRISIPLMSIFTTNYDTCIENFLDTREFDYRRGELKRGSNLIVDPSQYGSSAGGIEIVKLHGSVDYVRNRDEIQRISGVRLMGRDYAPSLTEQVIVYPIELSGYGHVVQSPFLDFLSVFRSRLQQNDAWLIIGFSFRDLTVASLMNNVIHTKQRSNEHPTVIVIDASPQPILDKLRRNGFETLANEVKAIEGNLGDPKVFDAFRNA